MQGCTITRRNGRLTITLPARPERGRPATRGRRDGPQLLQEIEGDFTIEVTVHPFAGPSKTSNDDAREFIGAGLVVYQDDGNFVRYFRAANGAGGSEFRHEEAIEAGQRKPAYLMQGYGLADRSVDPRKPLHLRVTRRGNTLTLYRRQADGSWDGLLFIRDSRLHSNLRIGVAAVNTGTAPVSVVFEGLKIVRHRQP